MHRLIMGMGPGQRVDHRDGDGPNNRRANLRLITNAQNRPTSTGCGRHPSTRA